MTKCDTNCCTPAEVDSTNLIAPPVQVLDQEYLIELRAEMPGVDEDSVDITFENDSLTIRASKPDLSFDGFDLAHCEFSGGEYFREFTISERIDRENGRATVKDGVLTLLLPKSVESRSHKVSVQAG